MQQRTIHKSGSTKGLINLVWQGHTPGYRVSEALFKTFSKLHADDRGTNFACTLPIKVRSQQKDCIAYKKDTLTITYGLLPNTRCQNRQAVSGWCAKFTKVTRSVMWTKGGDLQYLDFYKLLLGVTHGRIKNYNTLTNNIFVCQILFVV